MKPAGWYGKSAKADTRLWEQVYPGGQTTASLTTRANDVRAPGVTAVRGAGLVGSGYDPGAAAYTLQATAGNLSFHPTATQQRNQPVFVIGSWTSGTFQVSLNGVLLASSGQHLGAQAIANYDSANQRLVIQYLGIIPTSATTAQRTFSVTP